MKHWMDYVDTLVQVTTIYVKRFVTSYTVTDKKTEEPWYSTYAMFRTMSNPEDSGSENSEDSGQKTQKTRDQKTRDQKTRKMGIILILMNYVVVKIMLYKFKIK